MKRQASAQWEGSLNTGRGAITTDSGALLKTGFTFGSTFEDGGGTNAEELLAAALAASFSIAVVAELATSGTKAESIYTTATVSIEQQSRGWTVSDVALSLNARIPGVDPVLFGRAISSALGNCPLLALFKKQVATTAKLSVM